MTAKGIFGGIGGSFTALCCAGFPIALAFLTGIGLGFVINDFILFPILFISLGFMFYALHYNRKKHLSQLPIYVGIVSTIIVFAGIFIPFIIWLGVIGLFVATIWDFVLLRKCKTCEV